MATQTLEELKAENAAEEEKRVQAAQEDAEQESEHEEEPEAEPEEVAAEADQEPEDDSDSNDEAGDEEPEESTAWMNSDEEDEAKYTDSDAAAIRRKWKGKVKEKDEELEALKAENERLKSSPSPAPATTASRPKREEYDDDEAFFEALSDFKIADREAKQKAEIAANEKKAQSESQSRAIQKNVDAHYIRAQKLAEKSNIAPETYQTADMNVRQAFEARFPKAGDAIVDKLISDAGEGSEKLFYHLGVNATKRKLVMDEFEKDPTGIAAAMKLGEIKASLSAGKKRQSDAPNPPADPKGDSTDHATSGNLKKQYEAAHKKGNGAKAFSIMRKAKAQNIDTSKWKSA